jgi:hypothetical protein
LLRWQRVNENTSGDPNQEGMSSRDMNEFEHGFEQGMAEELGAMAVEGAFELVDGALELVGDAVCAVGDFLFG